jgi:hypothetical protein
LSFTWFSGITPVDAGAAYATYDTLHVRLSTN